MRLFSSGQFYLHQSSRIAAEWLCDRDTISQLRNTGLILSTVAQMQTMQRDTKLYQPDMDIYTECDELCAWLHASAFNYLWLIDYFIAIEDKCIRCFKSAPLTWDFKRALVQYVTAFDASDTETDWLPLTPSEARASYALDIKAYQYRRTPLPFWVAPARQHVATEVVTSAGVGVALPSSLVDLDLSFLDPDR